MEKISQNGWWSELQFYPQVTHSRKQHFLNLNYSYTHAVEQTSKLTLMMQSTNLNVVGQFESMSQVYWLKTFKNLLAKSD